MITVGRGTWQGSGEEGKRAGRTGREKKPVWTQNTHVFSRDNGSTVAAPPVRIDIFAEKHVQSSR